MIHDPLIRSIRPTVLLAEDDPDQSEMLSEILDSEGFNVDTAFSGDAALHKLRDHTYDLLILDIRMPGVHGQEVLRQFRIGEKGGHAPVVIVSAFATEQEMRKYRLDGADDSFSKPYDVHELLAAVQRLTGLKKGSSVMQPLTDNVDAQRLPHAITEFFAAVKNPFTYSPRQNHEVVFGFLWGLPVPFFALLIHAYAIATSLGVGSLWQIASTHPVYIAFFLHPLLFATIFGALGTMRAHREQQIHSLLRQVNIHCDELTRTNARLEELDRLKTEFLANVTHELKSPLVTALGYTDRILTGHLGDVTEKQRKGLEVSKRNLTRLRNLIDEILDFSRLESGMSRFKFQPTTLNAAIQMAVESAALKIRDRNLTITVEQPPASAAVDGDAIKLLQVVVNLLDNAIKFSPDGGKIHIAVARIADYWRCSIADQGTGIPPEKLSHLFERFFQADGSLARVHDGVGLGLVIVKKIIEAHHGKIWVESKVGAGSGTIVFVELPALVPQQKDSNITTVKCEQEVAHATNSTH